MLHSTGTIIILFTYNSVPAGHFLQASSALKHSGQSSCIHSGLYLRSYTFSIVFRYISFGLICLDFPDRFLTLQFVSLFQIFGCVIVAHFHRLWYTQDKVCCGACSIYLIGRVGVFVVFIRCCFDPGHPFKCLCDWVTILSWLKQKSCKNRVIAAGQQQRGRSHSYPPRV